MFCHYPSCSVLSSESRTIYRHLPNACLFNRYQCNHTGMALSQILMQRGPETYICPTFGFFFIVNYLKLSIDFIMFWPVLINA